MGKGQKYFDSGDYNMAKQGGRLGRGEIKKKSGGYRNSLVFLLLSYQCDWLSNYIKDVFVKND